MVEANATDPVGFCSVGFCTQPCNCTHEVDKGPHDMESEWIGHVWVDEDFGAQVYDKA